jgi:flagellar hook-length control protein FliK
LQKPIDPKQVEKVDEDDQPLATDDADAEEEPATDAQPVAKRLKKTVAAPAPTSAQQLAKPQPSEALQAAQSEPAPEALAIQAKKTDDDVAPQAVADRPDEPAAPAPVDDAPAPAPHVDLAQSIAADLQPKAPPAPAAPVAHPVATEPPAPPVPPEVRFAETNHPQIVTGMRGQLLPDGGTMHIRLDPPELGALQVSVHMQDGVMTASFQTSNDEATKLLSHSLAQLKHVLESQGVSVDKLHVTQTPRDQNADNDNPRQQPGSDNPSARQEQQRREILQRMWRKLTNGSDPLDMVA